MTLPPPIRCPAHDDEPANHPCPACGDARRYHEEWQREQRLADRENASRNARQRAADEKAAIARCQLCDDDGYIGARVCWHEPGQDAINARGVAACREALRVGARGDGSADA